MDELFAKSLMELGGMAVIAFFALRWISENYKEDRAYTRQIVEKLIHESEAKTEVITKSTEIIRTSTAIMADAAKAIESTVKLAKDAHEVIESNTQAMTDLKEAFRSGKEIHA